MTFSKTKPNDILENKTIVLGVTSSIACYKAVELASRLIQARACINVVMTPNATRMIHPLTFESITHNPVITDLFACGPHRIEHIALAQEADLIVVAPATANTLAKIAWGLADNALTTIILATRAPLLLAPAMESQMYSNPATQENLEKLRSRGYTIAGPAVGRLASGGSGVGRMVEPAELMDYIRREFEI